MSLYDPSKDPAVINGLQEAYGFKRGDIVEYINEYGGTQGPFTITGFCEPKKRTYNYTELYSGEQKTEERICNKTVYLNWDCCWFPVDPASLRKMEDTPDGI